jgi:hypothetical protein
MAVYFIVIEISFKDISISSLDYAWPLFLIFAEVSSEHILVFPSIYTLSFLFIVQKFSFSPKFIELAKK